jgi:hypothetical protein
MSIIAINQEKLQQAREAAARAERDRRLAATDWMVLPDQIVSQSVLDYRQALRDVPAQAGFPEEIEWPELPGGAD